MSIVPRGTNLNFSIMRYTSIALIDTHTTVVGAVVFHCSGSAVPSVQGRHGIYPYGKFISILWNFRIAQCWLRFGITQASLVLLSPCATFPSRMVCDHAENILRMPKGDTPWRTPVPMRAEPSLLRLCRMQPGEDLRSTPIRLNRKPYFDATIVPPFNALLT